MSLNWAQIPLFLGQCVPSRAMGFGAASAIVFWLVGPSAAVVLVPEEEVSGLILSMSFGCIAVSVFGAQRRLRVFLGCFRSKASNMTCTCALV